jgi:hypothetical protein
VPGAQPCCFFQSDGVRYVAFGTSGGIKVLNTLTGSRRLFTAACGKRSADGEALQVSLRAVAVADGRFLQVCERLKTPVRQMVLTNLATGAVANLAFPGSPTGGSEKGPLPVSFGSAWIQMYETFPERTTYFNATTHRVVVKPPESFTTYADLDAARPIQPLCRPVTRPVETPVSTLPIHPPAKVVGVSLPWVVMDNAGTLLAWRCGAPKPEILSTDARSAQLGARIVTWVVGRGVGNVANAERLDTGRHWQWSSSYAAFTAVVHTRNALYASECSGSACTALRLVKTSLHGL